MLLFCFVIGALMAATCAFVYSIFVSSTRAELDRDLIEAARPLVAQLSGESTAPDLGLRTVDQSVRERRFFGCHTHLAPAHDTDGYIS